MQYIEINFKIKDKEHSEIFRMLSVWRWRDSGIVRSCDEKTYARREGGGGGWERRQSFVGDHCPARQGWKAPEIGSGGSWGVIDDLSKSFLLRATPHRFRVQGSSDPQKRTRPSLSPRVINTSGNVCSYELSNVSLFSCAIFTAYLLEVFFNVA